MGEIWFYSQVDLDPHQTARILTIHATNEPIHPCRDCLGKQIHITTTPHKDRADVRLMPDKLSSSLAYTTHTTLPTSHHTTMSPCQQATMPAIFPGSSSMIDDDLTYPYIVCHQRDLHKMRPKERLTRIQPITRHEITPMNRPPHQHPRSLCHHRRQRRRTC